MIADVETHEGRAAAGHVAFHMDEEAFRTFYDRTAPALWAYVFRTCGDRQIAEDLVQETYYRFLRADATHENEAHRRAYLFRIATNLVRDGHRRRRTRPPADAVDEERLDVTTGPQTASAVEHRTDLTRALSHLKPRERALLWLAYVQGASHREIADTLDLKATSIKPLLFRARQKLAGLLRVTRRPDSGDAS
jgi:RNA polymerase sigma-70 factor (ECF subfamily)